MKVARRAATEWGVLSLDELRACGLSRDAVVVGVANGHLHPMYRGVYAVGHAKPPLEGFLLAAVKACGPGAVLSHHAAAAFWGLVPWDGRHLEVTVTGSTTRLHQGIRVHRTLSLEPRIAAATRASPPPHRHAPCSTWPAPGFPTNACAAPFAKGWPPGG